MMIKCFLCLLISLTLLLSGCGNGPTEPKPVTAEPEPAQVTYIPAGTDLEPTVPEATVQSIMPLVPEACPCGTSQAVSPEAEIDYSHTEDGYVMVRYTALTDQRLKVLVKGPSTTYNYNLQPGGWTVLPLSDGNGTYQVCIYRNISESRYAPILSADFPVQLKDEFAPFLRPNQFVDYTADSQAVALGSEIAGALTDPLEKVSAIYDYMITHLSYDTQKASTVQSGYLPVLDVILETGSGICFDYAAVMTAMLRSQNIPCKLVVGYAGSVYHAWISVWTEDSGWIDGMIFFDGQVWHRMDPTFASGASNRQEILDYIQNGTYTAKYLY